MPETITKTTTIPVTWIRGVVGNSFVDANDYTYDLTRGGSSTAAYVAIESVLTDNERNLIFGNGTTITVTKVELEFWHLEADLEDPIKVVEFGQMAQRPSTLAAIIFRVLCINGTKYASKEIHGIQKTKEIITLGSSSTDLACTTFTTRLNDVAPYWLAVGIRRYAYTGSEDFEGSMFVGGTDLLDGEGEPWQDHGDDIAGPPKFHITWEESVATTDFGRFEMRYTTEDPTSSQSTPQNSIGSHVASNCIYTTGQIDEFVSSTQTTINLTSGSSIPESSGLVQIGPEIMKYGGYSGNQLQSITRAVSPGYAFPACLYPFKEDARFLVIDNLFNTRPTVGLEQYRCVGIINIGHAIKDVQLLLRQNSSDNIQMDIGIEVPLFNYRSATLAAQVSSSSTFTSTSASVLQYDGSPIPVGSDLFEGGYITVGTTIAEITSYDTDGITATFIVDRSFSAAAGATFTIHNAPAQRITNDSTAPTENSGRFFGFLSQGGSSELNYNSVRESGNTFSINEGFYIWIRRTLTRNAIEKNDTGGIIILQFNQV